MPYGSLNGSTQLGAGWGSPSYPLAPMGQFNPMESIQGITAQPQLIGTPQMGERGFWDSTSIDPKTGVKITEQGYGMPALGVAQGAFNAWMGMKQYGLAKKQLAEGKQQFALNYDAQRTTTNAQLEDRQRARVASNAGAYQSVGDYMGANGIRPRG